MVPARAGSPLATAHGYEPTVPLLTKPGVWPALAAVEVDEAGVEVAVEGAEVLKVEVAAIGVSETGVLVDTAVEVLAIALHAEKARDTKGSKERIVVRLRQLRGTVKRRRGRTRLVGPFRRGCLRMKSQIGRHVASVRLRTEARCARVR